MSEIESISMNEISVRYKAEKREKKEKRKRAGKYYQLLLPHWYFNKIILINSKSLINLVALIAIKLEHNNVIYIYILGLHYITKLIKLKFKILKIYYLTVTLTFQSTQIMFCFK